MFRDEYQQKVFWMLPLVLAALTVAVYLVSFHNGFVWDDDYIIVKNPATFQLSGFSDLLFSPDVVKPYYRPLNRATYLLNYWLTGMNPAGFHAVNVLIHLLNVILFYSVGCRISSNRVGPFIAALLFAVHPLNTESVDFISARNNLLSFFFTMAAFFLYLRSNRKSMAWLSCSALLFLLGLLSKETAFMLIALLVLDSVYPFALAGAESWRGKMVKLLPYLLVVACYLTMRTYALQGIMGIGTHSDGLLGRLAQNFYSIPQYLRWFLFPADLTIFHTMPKSASDYSHWLFPAWAVIALGLWLIIRWHNKPALFGLLWFAVNYIPIANIVPIPSAPMAERYMYIPAAGLCLIVGEWCSYLYSKDATKRMAKVATFMAIAFLAALTVKRNLEWKDDVTLFASVVKNDPSSRKGHFSLGNALKDRGQLAAAQREWEKTLELDPGHPEALAQLGTLAAIQGNLPKAERYYLTALRFDPGNAMIHFNLGKIYELAGMPDKALEHFEFSLLRLPVEYAEYRQDIERRVARLRATMSPGAIKQTK